MKKLITLLLTAMLAFGSASAVSAVAASPYASFSASKTTAVKKPTVTASSVGKTVTLKWKKISGATGYQIYRSYTKNGTYKKLATVKKSTLSYKDKKAKDGTVYYKVRAYVKKNGKAVFSDFSKVKSVVVDKNSARTPAEIVADMKVGWNLGNTLDAMNSWDKSLTPLKQETAWGNPKTTQEMIDTVADKGFNTIRIPTTWQFFTGEAPDYKIDGEWLERVKEVVDYAYKNDMYVILNLHHENEWLIPNNANYDKVSEKFKAMWKQIAEYFGDYSDHLIFEGMNEPRVVYGTNEWNGGTAETRSVINKLNQDFIDTVRSTGGKNSTRLLLITTHAAGASTAAFNGFVVPDDDYIAMSLHAYNPYFFAFQVDSQWEYSVWDGSKSGELDTLFSDIDKMFISKGIPVVITEFGAQNKNNDDEIVKWLDDYLTRAEKLGIPCVWWDNNVYTAANSETFGLFNRKELTWYSDKVADRLTK